MGNPVPGISIVVPVGSKPDYKKYLKECIESIDSQAKEEDQIVFIDDMAQLTREDILENFPGRYSGNCKKIILRNAWYLGCAASWNIGVALSDNMWNILMGSDDRLLPGCLDACREVISNNPDPFGYYNLTCQDSDGNTFDWFNNAAMVSKGLWKTTKGFPLESSIGAPDALLISCLIAHAPHRLHQLRQGTPLYWVRNWEGQETRRTGIYNGEIISIRDKVTANFKWADSDKI